MVSMQQKVITVCLALLGLTINTQAWMMQGQYYDAAHPGKCTVNGNIFLTPGQKVKDPSNCAIIHCNTADGWATVTGCGAIAPPMNCKWDGYENVRAPFPVCCVQKLYCPNPADLPEAKKIHDAIKDMLSKQLAKD